MTITDMSAILTGERLLGKNTSDMAPRPSRDEAARLAYEFYEARGRQDGHDIDDWLSAEQQLTHHYR